MVPPGKFTLAGSVELRVRQLARTDTRVTLRFDVTDTGIAAGQQSQIFEPFSQGDSSTTRRFGSTGLGLSIVRRLVEMMRGQLLELESEPGKGSTFSVTLPLALAEPTRA